MTNCVLIKTPNHQLFHHQTSKKYHPPLPPKKRSFTRHTFCSLKHVYQLNHVVATLGPLPPNHWNMQPFTSSLTFRPNCWTSTRVLRNSAFIGGWWWKRRWRIGRLPQWNGVFLRQVPSTTRKWRWIKNTNIQRYILPANHLIWSLRSRVLNIGFSSSFTQKKGTGDENHRGFLLSIRSTFSVDQKVMGKHIDQFHVYLDIVCMCLGSGQNTGFSQWIMMVHVGPFPSYKQIDYLPTTTGFWQGSRYVIYRQTVFRDPEIR